MLLELASIVVEEHLADAAQVAEARAHARSSGEALVASLVEVAHVSDAALARTLARRLNLTIHAQLEADSDALREVPPDVARRHCLLPLALELPGEGARVLRVAMADPTDRDAIAQLESSTGCRIEPALASLATIDDAIARAYRGLVTEVIPRGERAETEPTSPTPPAPRQFGADLPEPSTQPFHSIEDEAPIELRLRALVQLLEEKGLLGEDEWLERIRALLRERE